MPANAAVVVDTSRSPHAKLRPVSVASVRLTDTFWAPRRRINRDVTIPSQHRHLETTDRLRNFRRASGRVKDVPFVGIYFNDSDVYKWLEAAAWTLATDPDPKLAEMTDAVIDEIAAAQQPDGYLNTFYMFDEAPNRFSNLKDKHELYCAGHFIQAAVAHHRATGKTSALDVARKLADHICGFFGPASEGKREQTDGHEEIELALVELYRDTGERRYLKQAQFFIDVRGRGTIGGGAYHQDHKPIREADRVTGHAVRQVYFTTGATDLYTETGDASLMTALERLWANMTTKQMYVSGGLGSRWEGEAFGRDFELPSERAYTETCAAIGGVMWAWRMLQVTGDAKFADAIELMLYNAVLPGLSLDGQHYFYQNPLTDDGTHRRQAWFGCACCPPNVARLLGYLPGHFYSVSDGAVWVHLYAEGDAELPLPDGRVVKLKQRTRFPWDGQIRMEVASDGEVALMLRVPEWAERGATVKINGDASGPPPKPGSYVELRRRWRVGDVVTLSLPMPVRRVEAHPHAAELRDRVALMRGPLLYCVEQADNVGIDPRDLIVPPDAMIDAAFRPDLLGGVTVLTGRARAHPPDAPWSGQLYRTAPAPTAPARDVAFTAIPYHVWANRDPGRMQVWLRSR